MSDFEANHNDLEDCHPPNAGQIEIPILPNLDFAPDPKLEAEGWERRFMADPTQVEEASRLYNELGFEVRTETIQVSELSEVCGSCRLATCRAYTTLYTRKRQHTS
ncbi:MAG: hypothetical protein GY803_08450 [Chloroflexi bacterium]|nr:hypothetical protein [Chloroflexota bacterium]